MTWPISKHPLSLAPSEWRTSCGFIMRCASRESKAWPTAGCDKQGLQSVMWLILHSVRLAVAWCVFKARFTQSGLDVRNTAVYWGSTDPWRYFLKACTFESATLNDHNPTLDSSIDITDGEKSMRSFLLQSYMSDCCLFITLTGTFCGTTSLRAWIHTHFPRKAHSTISCLLRGRPPWPVDWAIPQTPSTGLPHPSFNHCRI